MADGGKGKRWARAPLQTRSTNTVRADHVTKENRACGFDTTATSTGITDFTHRIRNPGFSVVYSSNMRYPVLATTIVWPPGPSALPATLH